MRIDHHLDIADFAGASAGLRGVVWVAAARPAEKDEPVSGARTERRPKGKVEGGGETSFHLCKVGRIRKGVPGSGSSVLLTVRGSREGREGAFYQIQARYFVRRDVFFLRTEQSRLDLKPALVTWRGASTTRAFVSYFESASR